jgi:ppGpp synthetase/RelA/SpoT-type nucleotidyltranferase
MSDEKKKISPQELQHQVAEYTLRQPDYKIYALALKDVLEKSCKTAFPDAFVQAREKSITSFAEKAVRKFEKYPDAVNQLTDLCGGRVIVQTLEQVKAVRQFIEANFQILEADEKGLLLGDDKFGYRDMHYIVRLIPGKVAALGFGPDQIKAIGDKRAEIQVRTWVQHAWADTLHDRMYKTKLKYPAEFKRAGALLAAIMEDGDRAFDRLAGDIDGMLANFNAYAPREEVERELDVQKLILSSADDKKKPEIALQIARLLAPRGDFAGVVSQLAAYADVSSPLGCAIRLELGYALCQFHRAAPRSDAYRQGQTLLQRVVDHCRGQTLETVPDLRKRVSTLARALARLAWSYEAVDEDAHKARTCYSEALELEPGNPYYLADVIGHEISYSRRRDFIGAMSASVRQAIATCREHIRNGTEMPYAAFTVGRLHLLLGESDEALGAYARGIRHVLACTTCVPPGVFAAEQKWLILVTKPDPLAGGYSWTMDLLQMAEKLQSPAKESPNAAEALKSPVLIVAGGAMSLQPGQADQLRPMLEEALTGFAGTVFSGGTRVGVPGCVGDAADKIGARGKRPFKLIGYLPRVRPDDAPLDERYEVCVKCGENSFTPEQILRNWTDILVAGVKPSDVRVLGYGGGPLSAVEYRIALGLGAWVGLVEESGGAVDVLLKDDLWAGLSNLLSLPCDPGSVRAHVHPPHARPELDAATVEKMGRAFHEEYVGNSTGRLPDNMKPWKKLPDTFKTANLEQAKYSVQILEACGFKVVPAADPAKPVVFDANQFTPDEVERMAEMEHGRWNVERLRNGWRYCKNRDDAKKLHNCLIPWEILPDGGDGVKKYDRQSVRKFPEILAQAGLEVHRM